MVLRVRRFGKELAQLVVHVGIGGYRGTHIDADGRRVDELHLRDAVCFHSLHMPRQGRAVHFGLQRRDEAFQNEGGLAAAGHTRDDGEPPLGQVQFQRLHGVDGVRGKVDAPQREQLIFRRAGPRMDARPAREKRPDLGGEACFNFRDGPLRNDVPALCTGFRAHLDEPVGFL